MATLLDVPNEILHHILSCLEVKSLITVSRVSRRFHSLSLPLLYKAPVLRARDGYRQPALPQLLWTLTAAPSLAIHIQSLELQIEPYPNPFRTSFNGHSLSYPVPHTGSGPPPRITQGLQLEQLLRMVPRLTHLDLWPLTEPDSYGSAFTHLFELLQDPMTLPLGLHYLRDFRAVGNWGMTSRLLVAVMTLPSIRTIAVTVDDGNPFYTEYEDVDHAPLFAAAVAAAVGSSSVTDLQFVETNIAPPSLTAILTVPRALTHLGCSSQYVETHFDLAAFGRSLEPLLPSLQHLSISYSVAERWEVDWHSAMTLREWRGLQTLECPMMALLGRIPLEHCSLVDVLPRGLRELCLTEDMYWATDKVVERLVTLLETGEMGSLQEMKLKLAGDNEVEENEIERLRRACEEAKVLFVVERKEIDVN